jgi:lysyl-tRNA synthetase class I
MRTTALASHSDLFKQDRSQPHWAYDYAQRLDRRVPPGSPIVIQTSMSPSGWFHIGNFRDTACAYLVHRALRKQGRDSVILLSFDDYDPIRPSQAAEQLDLAGYGSRPLGAATERSTAICRRYIAELKRIGICPAEADADGRTAPRSWWQTHYQYERYLAGTYADLQRRYMRGSGKLAQLLDVKSPGNLFTVYCEQCGRGSTRTLKLGRDRVRYACDTCGALATTSRIGMVKPSWALDWTIRVTHEQIHCEPAGQDHCSAGSTMDRTRAVYHSFLGSQQPVIVPYGLVRQSSDSGKVSGSRGGGMTLTELLAVLSPQLILWLYARRNCLSDFRISLQRSAFLAYYDEYDRFLASVRDGDRRATALYGLITDEPVPASPLPRMRTVLGLLHGHCYDAERVTAVLGAASAERVRAARRWLADHGRCWIDGAQDPDIAVDGRQARALCEPWDRATYRRLYLILFGTVDGPPLRRLREIFGLDEMVEAVLAYLAAGARPLRERVLAQLNSGDPDAG